MSYVDHGHRHLPGGTDPIPGGAGDYVFIAEAVFDGDANAGQGALVLDNIPQTYEALVVELEVGTDYDADALRMAWNSVDPQGDTPGSFGHAELTNYDGTAGNLQDAVDHFAADLADGLISPSAKTTFTFKFPFYQGQDPKGLWQAVSYRVDTEGMFFATGGIARNADDGNNGPITQLVFALANGNLAHSSRASLYGIRRSFSEPVTWEFEMVGT